MANLTIDDKLEIAETYSIYARAIDEKRYDLLDRVFLDTATLEYEVGPHQFACKGRESANYFGAFLKYCYWTNHLIAAPMIESGAGVFATTRVTATHLQKGLKGELHRWTLRGSYHDNFTYTDSGWRIAKRLCLCPDSEGEFLSDNVRIFDALAWTEAGRIRGQ